MSGAAGDSPSALRARLTVDWANTITRTAYVPMARATIEHQLRGLVDRMVDELTVPAYSPRAGGPVGQWLVAARLTGPDGLQRSMDLLGRRLLALPELGQVPDRADRVVLLLGALATGYAQALRHEVFQQQERVKEALLLAKENAERDLHDSQARFQQVFSSSAVGVVISDLAGSFVEANPALVEMLGYEAEDYVRHGPNALFDPSDAAALRARCRRMLDDGEDRVREQRQLTRRDSDTMWAYVALSVLRDAEGLPSYFVAVLEDITDLRMLQEYLRRQALQDMTTGLPNRHSFLSKLEEVLGRLTASAGVTLCYLDLDGVRVINDGLGCDAGDELLKTVAGRLSDVVADERATVARLGGDEFAILLEHASGTADVSALAESIYAELAEPIYLRGEGVAVPASMGFARATGRGVEPLELLRQAHSALRTAELGGKRQWGIYDGDRDSGDRADLVLAAGMPGAWENGELGLDFQPVFALADRRLAAIAVLLRWDRPGEGVLPHERSAGFAERIGLSVPLGRWLLHGACEQLAAWRDRFGDRVPPLSVGLSPQQSGDPDLVATVGTTLGSVGLPADWVQLELATGALVADRAEARENLEVLADKGIRIALHGFGGGLDELALLESGRVRLVRLAARPLTRLDTTDSATARAVAAVVALAHSTGTLVTVDGVESASQADWYRSVGVDYARGRYLAPPVGSAGLTELLVAELAP
ncbi:putative bifunctional diguanylate cyclase/phosphodiesterase [Solihabitans fulvus]|nr:EAL domain-containing protein [Solihabitans fulvus]